MKKIEETILNKVIMDLNLPAYSSDKINEQFGNEINKRIISYDSCIGIEETENYYLVLISRSIEEQIKPTDFLYLLNPIAAIYSLDGEKIIGFNDNEKIYEIINTQDLIIENKTGKLQHLQIYDDGECEISEKAFFDNYVVLNAKHLVIINNGLQYLYSIKDGHVLSLGFSSISPYLETKDLFKSHRLATTILVKSDSEKSSTTLIGIIDLNGHFTTNLVDMNSLKTYRAINITPNELANIILEVTNELNENEKKAAFISSLTKKQ